MHEHNGKENGTEKSAFDHLLETDEEFYWEMDKYLQCLAARKGVPSSEIDYVVRETWLASVKQRHRFSGVEIKRHLRCWLSKVVCGKAVDRLRRLGKHPCQSFEAEWIDAAATKCMETAVLCDWLNALLEKIRPGNEENVSLLCAHYFQGYSILELAEQLGMTTDSVDSRIRRMREKLRGVAEQSLK